MGPGGGGTGTGETEDARWTKVEQLQADARRARTGNNGQQHRAGPIVRESKTGARQVGDHAEVVHESWLEMKEYARRYDVCVVFGRQTLDGLLK